MFTSLQNMALLWYSNTLMLDSIGVTWLIPLVGGRGGIRPWVFFFSMAQQPLVGQGLLIIEASRSHTSDTSHSVGLLWWRDQLVAETST
jgi:hypothetical protein